MYPLVLPEEVFDKLLMIFAIAPLLLLFLLPRFVSPEQRGMFASLILFLPALLLIGFWGITNGQTKPPLGDVGPGLVIGSGLWISGSCIVSFVCGLNSVRTQRWVLLWMIPQGLMLLPLVYFLLVIFFPHLIFPRP